MIQNIKSYFNHSILDHQHISSCFGGHKIRASLTDSVGPKRRRERRWRSSKAKLQRKTKDRLDKRLHKSSVIAGLGFPVCIVWYRFHMDFIWFHDFTIYWTYFALFCIFAGATGASSSSQRVSIAWERSASCQWNNAQNRCWWALFKLQRVKHGTFLCSPRKFAAKWSKSAAEHHQRIRGGAWFKVNGMMYWFPPDVPFSAQLLWDSHT